MITNASGLDDVTMQALARQLNLIETVFVFPEEKTQDSSPDFRLRYFTPGIEIPVAGHPTIAAWIALLHKKVIDVHGLATFLQINLAGTQEIEIDTRCPDKPVVTMKQPPPRFLDGEFSRQAVASVFALDPEDVDANLPVRPVDTGLGQGPSLPAAAIPYLVLTQPGEG